MFAQLRGHGGLDKACKQAGFQRLLRGCSGVVMKKLICEPAAAARLDQQAAAGATGLSYRRHVSAKRALFAAPPVDLLTLVVAEAVRRKAQAEIQREALRDAVYEMPVPSERNHDGGAQIQPSDSEE